jgi:hypothetical protein
MRVGAGEVYIFKGTKISVDALVISGPGIKNNVLLPGTGSIFINYSFRHSNGPGLVENAFLEIEPDRNFGTVGLIDGDWSNDIHFMTLDEQNSTLTYMGNVGRISLLLEPSWHMRLDEPYDMKLTVNDTNGNEVSRDFNDALEVVRSLELVDSVELSMDGISVGTNNQWLSPGSEISFSGLKVVYDTLMRPQVPPGTVYLDLFRDSTKVDEVLLTSSSSSMTDTVPFSDEVEYRIAPRTAMAGPEWNGPPFSLELKGEIVMELSIDDTLPLPPEGLYLEPDDGRLSLFDDDTKWKVGWDTMPGSYLDQGSTVKEFEVSLDDQIISTAREVGGLFGSYYNGSDFGQLKLERIDGPVDFPITEWKKFGPAPEDLYFYDFSIRWDGWFKVPSTRNFQFALSGTEYGHAKLVMDGRNIIDWSSLSSAQNSVPRFMNEGDIVPVQIYYYFFTTDYANAISAFSFQYLDDKGIMVPVPSSYLYHSANSSSFDLVMEEEFTISVRSIDWVGLRSDPVTITGYVDSVDPVVNLSDFRQWYGSSTPTIEIGFRDPTFGGIPSSGIDPDSLQYRLRNRSSTFFEEWTSEGISHSNIGTEFMDIDGAKFYTRIEASFELSLEPSWRGSIQWKISDRVGNSMESSVVDFGIDSKGPEFELLSPNIQVVQDEGINTIIARVADRPGAGVDIDTLEYRLDTAVVENRPPIPGIKSPGNGSIIKIGNPLVLDGSNTQDDGLGPYVEIRYTWISNVDGYLGNGRILQVYLENLGEHRINLYVDDGEFNMSTSIYVTLDPNTPIDDDIADDDDLERPTTDFVTPLIFSLIFLVIIVIGVFILFKRYRDRQDEETRLDYVEKTGDDEDYDRRIEEEERSLGIHMEKDTRTKDEIEKERKKLYGDD